MSSAFTSVRPDKIDLQANIIADLAGIGDLDRFEGHITDLGDDFIFDQVSVLLKTSGSEKLVRIHVSWSERDRQLSYRDDAGQTLDVSRDRYPSMAPTAEDLMMDTVLRRAAATYQRLAAPSPRERWREPMVSEDIAVGLVLNLVVTGLLVATWLVLDVDPDYMGHFAALFLISLVLAPFTGSVLRRAFLIVTDRKEDPQLPSGKELFFSSFDSDSQRQWFFEVLMDRCAQKQVDIEGNVQIVTPVLGDRATVSFDATVNGKRSTALFDGKNLSVRNGAEVTAV